MYWRKKTERFVQDADLLISESDFLTEKNKNKNEISGNTRSVIPKVSKEN